MTRDEHRAKCMEAIADALYITPEEATAAFDSLHGIAAVCPILSEDSDHLVLGGDLTNPPGK